MYQELSLELAFPYLKATYRDDLVVAPMPLGLENLLLLEFLQDRDRYAPAVRERLVVLLGQQLFDALIPAPILPLYRRATDEQRRTANAFLRIRVVAGDPRLLTLPWEFFYDSRQGVFPATAPQTCIVRTPGIIHPEPALSPQTSLRLLVAASSPSDDPPLNFELELAAIEGAARRAGVEIRCVVGATRSAMRAAIEELRPHVVHFIGHGFADALGVGIHLQDRAGKAHRIPGDQLARWLEPAGPRLVVLNACESARRDPSQQGRCLAEILLEGGIPAVIAMQHRIPDAAGVAFGHAFFDALFTGASLERAVQSGRYALLVAGGLLQSHFATPVLYLAAASGGQLVQAQGTEVAAEVPAPARKPFLYLDSFGRADRALFFGRSKAIEALVSRVATHRMLVVHGRSGVGKTSLLQAGLEQSTAAGLYVPVTLRFVVDPLEALRDAVAAATHSSPEALTSEPEAQLLRLQEQSGRTVLLILDQFEEFFILLSPEVQQRFLEVLQASFANPELRLRIVVVIREEFFGELEQLREFFPAVLANSYALAPLTEEEAREALVGPLRFLGIPFEPPLIDEILGDLRHEMVDPVSLQIVGHHLFEACARQTPPVLTLQTYEALGRARGILNLYLAAFLQRFTEADQAGIQAVLEQFITDQGTRQPTSIDEICLKSGLVMEEVRRWIDRLAEARLIRRIEGSVEAEGREDELAARWELAHEVLIYGIQENQVSSIRRQVRELRSRMRRMAITSNLSILAATIVLPMLLYFFMRHGLQLRVEAPDNGDWELELLPGQRACTASSSVAPSRYPVRNGGRALFMLPVGFYEGTLRGKDQSIRFPVHVTPAGWSTLPTKAPVTVREIGLELVYVHVSDEGATLGTDNALMREEDRDATRVVTDLKPFFVSRTPITRGMFLRFIAAQAPGYETDAERGGGCLVTADGGEGVTPVPASWRDPQEVFRAEPEDSTGAAESGLEKVERLGPEALERLPVVNVTLTDARAFVGWLSQVTGQRFRLPTDDEWELAARGLDQRTFPWGDCFTEGGNQANLRTEGSVADAYSQLSPVGSFEAGASPVGALDMAGNVWEFVEGPLLQLEKGTQQFKPAVGGGESWLGLRGGSFRSNRINATVVSHSYLGAENCAHNVGFRVVMDPPSE